MKKITANIIEQKTKLNSSIKKLEIATLSFSLVFIAFVMYHILMIREQGFVFYTNISLVIIECVIVAIVILCAHSFVTYLKVKKDLQSNRFYAIKDTVIEKRQFQKNLLYFKHSIASPSLKAQYRVFKTIKDDGFPVHGNTYANTSIGDEFYLIYSESKDTFLCILPSKSYSAKGIAIYEEKGNRKEARPDQYSLVSGKQEKIIITKEIILEHMEDVVHNNNLFSEEKKMRERLKDEVLLGNYEIKEDVIVDRVQTSPSDIMDGDWTNSSFYVQTRDFKNSYSKTGIQILGLKNFVNFQIDDSIYIVCRKNSNEVITAFPGSKFFCSFYLVK